MAHDVFLQKKSACGEIGRRARLRIWCRETCRFESYQAHFSCGFPFRCTSKGIFCACSGKLRKHSAWTSRLSCTDRKPRARFLPSVALFLVAPPYLSSLSGESTKHRPTFEKSLGVFSLNSPSFTRAYVRARQSISGEDLHPSPPYPILLTGRHLRVKAFASSPPSPTRTPSSRSSPTFFEPSEIPDNCSPKR